jgi:hypothetical protein
MANAREKDPVIEAYKQDLDKTLIKQSLRLTIQQRVDRLIALQEAAEEFRRAGKQLRLEKKHSE